MVLNRRDFLAGLMGGAAVAAAAPVLGETKGIWLPRVEEGLILPGDADFEDFVEDTEAFQEMAARESWEGTNARLVIQWTRQWSNFGGSLHGYSRRYLTGRRENLDMQSVAHAMASIEKMITITADRIDNEMRLIPAWFR